MNIWIAVCTVFAIGMVALVFAIQAGKRTRSLSALNKRKALSDDEIYRYFYAASGFDRRAVIDVWHHIADILRVPAEHLRPTDRFGEDIGVDWHPFDNKYLGDLEAIMEEKMERRGLTVDLASIETVDDYVKCLASQN